MYYIKKVLNSSVILVVDKNDNEFIMLGKGIGYGKKVGTEILDIEKNQIFVPIENSNQDKFISYLDEIPFEILQVTQKIILEAKKILGVEFNNNLYFILADHLYYSIERMKKGIKITNRLFWEIKNYYPDEFKAGLVGLYILEEDLGILISEEEASNLAFHFANSKTSNDENYDSFKYAKVIGEIVNIIIFSINKKIDKKSIHYLRFITHIKFFVERFFTEQMLYSDDKSLYNQLIKIYSEEVKIVNKIKYFLKDKYEKDLTLEEITYLILHISRITENSK